MIVQSLKKITMNSEQCIIVQWVHSIMQKKKFKKKKKILEAFRKFPINSTEWHKTLINISAEQVMDIQKLI